MIRSKRVVLSADDSGDFAFYDKKVDPLLFDFAGDGMRFEIF